MIEAVMLWNEPNNKSHWDFEIDPDWSRFAEMTKLAGQAIAAERARQPGVLSLYRVAGELHHLAKDSPVAIDLEVPVRLVVRLVPEHHRFDQRGPLAG